MGGEPGLVLLGCDGGGDDGGAVAIAHIVLHDEHRAHTALLAAHHRTEIRIIDLAASDDIRLMFHSITLRRNQVGQVRNHIIPRGDAF